MRRVRSHIFRGKRWRIRWRTGRGKGYCEAPTAPEKEMTINPRQKDIALLDTLIHESLHACHWDMDEEAVEETATDIARLLWRLGYRLDSE